MTSVVESRRFLEARLLMPLATGQQLRFYGLTPAEQQVELERLVGLTNNRWTCTLLLEWVRGRVGAYESLRTLEPTRQTEVMRATLKAMSPRDAYRVSGDWWVWARDKQLEELLPRQNWQHWLLMCGRGFGKTRTEVEWLKQQMGPPDRPGNMARVAVVCRTPKDARDTIVEGESGLLAKCPKDNYPVYEPSRARLTWPNGGKVYLYSSKAYDQLRGPQHDGYLADELAAWLYPQAAWDQLQFTLRLTPKDGRPRGLIGTTPRPIPLIKELFKRGRKTDKRWNDLGDLPDGDVYVTMGHTDENQANLNKMFVKAIYNRYSGTSMGDQELGGAILGSVPGALWAYHMFRFHTDEDPRCEDVVIAVDPQGADPGARGEGYHSSTGIVVCGRLGPRQGLVLADLSDDMSPMEWAKRAVDAFYHYGATCIVAEVNKGGALVEQNIKAVDPVVPVVLVHASESKRTRAQPIANLYEQGRIWHVGTIPSLEDAMCSWDPDDDPRRAPDNLDAAVWGLTWLLLEEGAGGRYSRDTGLAGAGSRW